MNILLVLLYLIILYVVYDFFYKNLGKFRKNKYDLPSPLALPIIGHLFLFDKNKMTHEIINELAIKNNNGLYQIFIGDYRTVILSTPKIVKEVCITRLEEYGERPNNITLKEFSKYKNLLLSPYSRWKPLRSLLSVLLTKYKIKKSDFIIENQTKQLIKTFYKYSDNPFNPKIFYYRFNLNILFEILFSKKIPIDQNDDKDNGELSLLLESLENVSKKISYGGLDDLIWFIKPFYYLINKKYIKSLDNYYKATEKIYDQHLLNPKKDDDPKDLMDLLIEEGTEKYDKDTIIRIANEIQMASSDTTLAFLQWFVIIMANNQEIQEKCYNEIIDLIGKDCKFIEIDKRKHLKYFETVIKEVFRYRIPVPLSFPRTSLNDTYLDGYFIPKNTQIIININGMAKNPDFVENPNEFLPERWSEYYRAKEEGQFNNNDQYYNNLDKIVIPFSTGIKNCFGISIAESAIFSVCANLLINFKIVPPNGIKIPDIGKQGVAMQPQPFDFKLEKRF